MTVKESSQTVTEQQQQQQQKPRSKREQELQQQQRGPQPSTMPASVGAQDVSHTLPADIQQAILNVFQLAFPVISQQDDYRRLVQEVKGHLYKRDFSAAFSRQEYLDVYALRWSAARALAYAHLFTHPDRLVWFATTRHHSASSEASTVAATGVAAAAKPSVSNVSDVAAGTEAKKLLDTAYNNVPPSSVVQPERLSWTPMLTEDRSNHLSSIRWLKAVCVGGGAGAEFVALAAASRYLNSFNNAIDHSGQTVSGAQTLIQFDICAVDVANWSESVRKLSAALTSPLPPQNHASPATPNTHRALLDPDIDCQPSISFEHRDILQFSPKSLTEKLRNVSLITMMFTLNELFGSSLSRTTRFILDLTEATEPGAHLVVVDSPGSYSEIMIGKTNQTRKYPMKWLLDHTLLQVAGTGEDARWLKIEDEDSKWFRLDEKLGLTYGIALENCRYQIHVFRKLK